jgi:integrase
MARSSSPTRCRRVGSGSSCGAGVRPIGLHGARHTHATLALAAGARLDVVSRQLGHASIAITADVYGHPDDDAAAKAAQIVGRVIEGRT